MAQAMSPSRTMARNWRRSQERKRKRKFQRQRRPERQGVQESLANPSRQSTSRYLIADREAFKLFAKEKAPTSRNRQYLVAALWLKENANSATVNVDKIYTCFKTAGWSVGFNDWRAPFDNLVYTEQMRKVTPGEFAINPLGEDTVNSGKE